MIIPAVFEIDVIRARVRSGPLPGTISSSSVPVPSRLRKRRSVSVESALPAKEASQPQGWSAASMSTQNGIVAENSTGKVRLKIPDVNTDPEGGACTECFNDFGGDLNLTTDWKQYIFPWKAMKQMPGWGNPRKPHITPSKLFGIQFQVNVPSANYDIFIDDIKFVCQ